MDSKFKFSFKCTILRVFDNGFTALEEGYLIQFQDNQWRPPFLCNDNIYISLEDAQDTGPEVNRPNYRVVYCKLKNYLSNGIRFVDCKAEQRGFFWAYRGFLTHSLFESDDIWEKDTILRIMLRKVNIPP